MPSELSIQKAVHALETGKMAVWVRRFLILAGTVALALFYLTHEFRGMATSQAMDQAQIGREILRGNGWSTKLIRPLAIGELQRGEKPVTPGIWLDTYNAPLPPLVDAAALALPLLGSGETKPVDYLNSGDLAISITSMLLFVCSVAVLYLIALELFDQRLALLACGLVLLCNMMWQYSLSGLPQMLLLLLFHLTIYALIRAKKAQYLGGRFKLWLAAAGSGFGLLALSHALTIWIFAAALAASILWYKPRRWAAVILLGVFLALYTPWLVRNYTVCGNPYGLALHSLSDGAGYTGSAQMRQFDATVDFAPRILFHKIRANLVTQFNRIFEYLGWSFVAPVAFVSLLHPFKRPATEGFRWMLLAMWAGAVLGMAAFGISEEQGVAANQLHLLFVPLLTCYGLAYLLVQWDRRVGLAFVSPHWNRLAHATLRRIWLSLLFVLCGLPLVFTLISSSTVWLIRWPPYMPQYISVLRDWMKPDEIIASDMPWAVAWYGDRRSVWLPMTIREFNNLNDYKVLEAPVNGLYLTPVSGGQNTLADIYGGEYQDWSPLILHNWDMKNFPLHWGILLGTKDCLFLSDRDRRLDGVKR